MHLLDHVKTTSNILTKRSPYYEIDCKIGIMAYLKRLVCLEIKMSVYTFKCFAF